MRVHVCIFLLSTSFLLLNAGCATVYTSKDKNAETTQITSLHNGISEIGDLGLSYLPAETTIFTSQPGHRHVLFPEESSDPHFSFINTGSNIKGKIISRKPFTQKSDISIAESAWEKFCTGQVTSDEEQEHIDINPIPAKWSDSCFPMK